MSELKPCPKCGPDGVPLRRIGEMDEYRVECIECYTVQTPWFKTPGEAEAYWNAFAEGMKQQDARITELEAERDRLREVLKEVLNCEVVTDTGDYSKGGTGFDCNEVKEIIREALEGSGE